MLRCPILPWDHVVLVRSNHVFLTCSDWLITGHVTQITRSDWLSVSSCLLPLGDVGPLLSFFLGEVHVPLVDLLNALKCHLAQHVRLQALQEPERGVV